MPASFTPDQDDLMQRIARDLVDSYDEELELEIEDRHVDEAGDPIGVDRVARASYFKELFRLQGELVKLQDWVQHSKQKVVILFEGRDAAGKGGVIKRITQRLNPRVARVAALPAPNDRERTQWYFQRYVAHLPAAGEIVLFDRSWYNRAGVEVVMDFSTVAEQAEFLRDAPDFERMLVESGIRLVKLWLDISKDEQAHRLEKRRTDPLKALKVSDLDKVAQDKWDAYTAARDTMLTRTHSPLAPWTCVRADDKHDARRAILRHLLHRAAPEDIAHDVPLPDADVLFPFETSALTDGRLAR